MARLGLAGWAGAIAVGMVVCVAVAPVSNWSFKNDVTTVLSSERIHSFLIPNRGQSPWPWFDGGPPALLDAKQIPKTTKESRLARALGLAEWDQANPTGNWDHGIREGLWELEAFCTDNPEDAVALAHFVRLLSQSLGGVIPTEKTKATKQYQDLTRRMRPIFDRMLALSDRGAAMEPANAFWPFMRAIVLCKLERLPEAKEVFIRAADCKSFDDHALAAPKLCLQEFGRRWGYRGEAVRLIIPASVLFPHYTSVKALFKAFCSGGDSPEDLKVRWAGITLANMMMRDGTTAISMVVGRASLAIAVVGDRKMPDSVKRAKGVAKTKAVQAWEQRLAESLDSKLAAAGISVGTAGPSVIYADSKRLLEAVLYYVGDPQRWPITEHPFIGSVATALGFTVVLLFIPMVAAMWAWNRWAPEAYDRSRLFLFASLVFVGLLFIRLFVQGAAEESGVEGDIIVLLMLVLYAATFATALIDKSKKLLALMCWVTGIAIVLVTLGSAPVWEAVVIVGLANAFYLFLAYRMPVHVLTTVVVAGVVFALAYGLIRFQPADAGSQLGQALSCVFLLLCAAPSKWFRNWAAASALVVSLCYVGATVYSLQVNSELKTVNLDVMREANVIREKAGLPRLPEEGRLDGNL